MQLLGARTVPQFLSRYWQKRPLVVRNAIPAFRDLLNPSELFRLAASEDTESRLVRHVRRRWSLEHGPFRAAVLRKMPARNWTLLVQGLNLHNDGADRLLRQFNFIPHARLDDVMVSYAVPGGGVGPHLDSYDVFLLQGAGRRLWRIGHPGKASLIAGAPLRILKNFEPEEELLLESGDLLYLPPGWAHDGIALEPCLTYSIGFRAPARRELVSEFLIRLSERILEGGTFSGLYQDRDLQAQSHPSAIPQGMIDKTAALLAQVRFTRRDIVQFLGEYLSEPKPRVVFKRPDKVNSLAVFSRSIRLHGVRLDTRTLMLHAKEELFVNGERHVLMNPVRAQLVYLADHRELPPGSYSQSLGRLLYDWYVAGWLRIGHVEPDI